MALALFPWSYTKAQSYYTCQRQFYYKYIEKCPEEQAPQTLVGLAVHHIIAELLKNPTRTVKQALTEVTLKHRLPREVMQIVASSQNYINNVVQQFQAAEKKVEYRFGLTENQHPCAFFDRSVFFRGVCDLVILQPQPVIIDFKTSTPKETTDASYALQLQLYAWAIQKVLNTSAFPKAQLLYVYSGAQQDIDTQQASDTARAFLEKLKQVTTVANIPTVGAHCAYCGYKRGCDAGGTANNQLGEAMDTTTT